MNNNSKLHVTLSPSSSSDNENDDNKEEDILAPLCTCGQFNQIDDTSTSLKASSKSGSSNSTSPKKTPTWLESSFVHLMAPKKKPQQYASSSLSSSSPTSSNNKKQQQQQHHQHVPSQHGFLEQHQHLSQLVKAATCGTSSQDCEEIALCSDCIDRVAAALEADTQRLYVEVHAYQESVTDAKQRNKTFEAIMMISNTSAATTTNNYNYNNNNVMDVGVVVDWKETERAYQNEIEMLRQEVQAREDELAHLNALLQEQLEITNHLESYQDEMEQEQNALELQARAFDGSSKLLTKMLTQIQTEVDQLSVVKLPQVLFDLQVDERGLRYPLINHLRLAYRPKGDVPSKEIQVAWSQATQLLLVLGSLLQYPSSDWKLVPLADCAKIIYRKEIFNMSPGDCRSLMAWNVLLDQIMNHAKTFTTITQNTNSSNNNNTSNNHSPPFVSSPNSIGGTELTRLDRMDHQGWSQVIHRMASNLLWLSERTSELVALQVSTTAHSIV